MTKNQYKPNNSEKISSKKEKKEKKRSGITPFKNLTSWVSKINSNPKISNTVGMFFLLFSVFTLLAFSSYFITWQNDQNLVGQYWTNIDVKVDNWLGKVGANFSHFMIFKGFGVSAFLFSFLTFLLGFKILFKISLLPLKKTFKYSIFSLVWISITLAFIFKSVPILGGTFGYQIVIWLNNLMGNSGIILILLFSLMAFLIFNFNINFKYFIPSQTLNNDNLAIDEEQESTLNSLNNETEVITEDLVDDEIETIEITDLSTELPTKNKENNDEIEFSVEETENKEDILTEDEIDKKAEDFGEYDPTLDLSSYQIPPIELLKDFGNTQKRVSKEELEANKNRILETLSNYNIKITSIKATIGPTVTLYEIVPEAGVRISKIKNLEDDIALSLAALGIRIIAPMPGKGTIGIEVPNQNPEVVSMKTVIASDKFQNAKMELPIVLGKTITNETYVFAFFSKTTRF